MKRVLLIAGGAMMGFGLVSGQWLVAVAGLIVLGFGAVVHSLDASRARSSQDVSELGAEARWLLRPIRELRESLQQTANRASDPGTKVIAQEAVTEADGILRKAAEMASAREQLRRMLKGEGEAETNLGRLERQLEDAQSPEEKSALESAVKARKEELASYSSVRTKVAEIDGRLKVAEATLAELKAKLATGLAVQEPGHEDEFNDLVQRLRTLGQSFDEAQELVQDRNL